MKEIKVCSDCHIPLIWTFIWAYNEYYCINCGWHLGMLGAGDDVELTPELKAKNKVIKRIWKSIASDLLPRSPFRRVGCKECSASHADHRHHLSKYEKRKDRFASSVLKKMRGAWL